MMSANLPRLGQATALLMAIAVASAVATGAQAGAQQEAKIVARGPVTNLPLPRFVSLRAETANARRGPSLDQRVDWEFVGRGLPLEVTGEYGHWRRVQDSEGYGGWIHHSLLSGQRTALVQADAPVPLHAGPNDASAVRAMAEPGVVGRLEACREAWCEIAAGGVDGWLPRAVLWGVGPDEAID